MKAGETVKFSIRLTGRNGPAGLSRQVSGRVEESIPASAVHLEVRNPGGKILDYYGANLLLTNGSAEFAVPLALNDRPGMWRVTAREPFTHQTTSTTFVVLQ